MRTMKPMRLICLFSSLWIFLLTNTIFANTYYVAPAPNGDNSNDGSIHNPWATFEFALEQLLPGDILRLREGTYYESSISIDLKGTAASPICIESYPGERAVIDGGVPFFKDTTNTEWELVDSAINLYKSKRTFSGTSVNAWLINDNLHLIEYETDVNIEAEYYGPVNKLTPLYQGPGIQLQNDGYLYIRLTQNPMDLIDYKGFPIEPVPVDINPNNHEIAVFFSHVLFYLNAAEHLNFKDIDFNYADYIMDIKNAANNIEFDNCKINFGRYGMVVRDAHDFNIYNCDFNNGLPQNVYWTDVKNRPVEVHEPYPEFQSTGIEGSIPGFKIVNCTFRDGFDGLFVDNGTSNTIINHNTFIRLRDDAITFQAGSANIEFAYNVIWHVGSGVSTAESTADPLGHFYIHHNIIDVSIYQHGGRTGNYRASDWPVWMIIDPFGSHGNMVAWWKVYNNTIVTRRSGYDWAPSGPRSVIGNPEKYVLNNIFLILDDRIIFRGDNISSGAHYDGNVFYRISPGRYPLFYDFGNGNNYNSLSEFRMNSGTNWELNGLETDPELDPLDYNEEPSDSSSFWERYRPGNSQMFTMGASYSGFDWPGTENIDYRGAVKSATVSDASRSTNIQHSVYVTAYQNTGGITSFVVELENPAAFTLSVYDIYGRKIWSYRGNAENTKYKINANDLNASSGFYVVSVQQQNELFTRKFMIVNYGKR
ncbi:right-handed parallel beta-helix repeat-containing protein [Bacteroidota bacterium]